MGGILVIEDDLFILRTLKRVLELHKLLVEVADNEYEAVVKTNKIKPKVILLSVFSQKINGVEILTKIRQSQKTKKSTIIALIDFMEVELLEKIKSMGVDDYIIKSEFTPSNIVDKVKLYL